jgi:hypothetical protein
VPGILCPQSIVAVLGLSSPTRSTHHIARISIPPARILGTALLTSRLGAMGKIEAHRAHPATAIYRRVWSDLIAVAGDLEG